MSELATAARRGPWEYRVEGCGFDAHGLTVLLEGAVAEGWELMTTETAADGVLLFLRRPSSDAEGVVSGA